MKKIVGKFMLFVSGWKFEAGLRDDEYKKCVLICAPHTSNWDFYYTLAIFWSVGIPYKIFIKDNYTKPWYGFIFKSLGCIGIDRGKRNNMVEYAAEIIKNSEAIAMANTPEATRSWARNWKKGFYYIAKEAGVPIVLAYADYKNKVAGITKVIYIEGKSVDQVFDEIQGFYKPEMAKYPEKYNPKIH